MGLEKWLQELWKEKENLLSNFYDEGVSFPANSSKQNLAQPLTHYHYISLFAWSAFLHYTITNYIFSPYFILYVIVVSTLMYGVSKYTDGLQEIEIKLNNKELWKVLVSGIKRQMGRQPHNDNSKKSE